MSKPYRIQKAKDLRGNDTNLFALVGPDGPLSIQTYPETNEQWGHIICNFNQRALQDMVARELRGDK